MLLGRHDYHSTRSGKLYLHLSTNTTQTRLSCQLSPTEFSLLFRFRQGNWKFVSIHAMFVFVRNQFWHSFSRFVFSGNQYWHSFSRFVFDENQDDVFCTVPNRNNFRLKIKLLWVIKFTNIHNILKNELVYRVFFFLIYQSKISVNQIWNYF